MVTLNAARPGTMHAYLGGIRALIRHFPTRWSALVAADLLVRSERWMRIREDLTRGPAPPGFDPRAPWDYVIAASAYGRDGPLSRWWQDEVVLPLSLHGGRPPCLEGLPGQASSSSSAARGPPPPPRGSAAKTRQRGPKSGKDVGRNADETCNSYNSGVGQCKSGDAVCKHGRRHVCAICKEVHQAFKAHPEKYVAPSKGGAGKGDKRKR